MDGSFGEPYVITKSSHIGLITRMWLIPSVEIQIKKFLMSFKKILNPPHLRSQATVVYHKEPNSMTEEEDAQLIQTKREINRKAPEICYITDNIQMDGKAVKLLDEAINFHQSDYIAQARTKLRDLSTILSTELGSRNFTIPTRYGWEVLNRGKELFLENDVSCSVKHGIIVLDSGNAQFYVSLLNILGAFAVDISEFEIAKETFSILIELHGKSDATSQLRDIGAAYNNRGCLSLIMGELNQADSDFKNSLKHLNCAKQRQVHGFSIGDMIIAVRSNISRLNLISRKFAEGLKEQEKLVESCKKKIGELPFQTIFMVLQNKAALYTTLGMFSKAEKELKWLISHCKRMRREMCDLLLNFVSLQLCEILLLRGKPKEAERVFPFEALTSSSVHELMATFGGLHFNVRMETFDKMIDVLVLSGKIKFARDLLLNGMTVVKTCFGPDHFNVASLVYKEGLILKLMGEVRSSMEKFEFSVEILREIFGDKHPLLIKCYMSLGDVAFRLGQTDGSHLYFQRAMENVEIIHEVSFLDQLSMKYIEITGNSKHIPNEISQGGKNSMQQEQMIEGLVAEYGPALAVLLSRLERHSSKRPKGKRPLYRKSAKVQYSESVLLISQKSIRDLLKSGQTLLRQGMRKEAVAFFQQASKYCQAYHDSHCHPNASLVRLYGIISHTCLTNQSKTNNHALNSYLQELKEVTANSGIEDGPERNSEDTDMLTFDSQLTLKLMLIFLILFTIQLKMHDTTFAAYDLYSKLSPNDDKFLLTLNDDLRVYVSRTSVTCNGKTIVQDVLVSSAIDLNESDSECNLPGKPLFKSLAYKNNAPSDSFLVTCNTSGILDIDELQLLDKKILRSVQEYIQVKSFGGDREGTATQVIVDLTSMCSREQDVLLTGSRIDLLPLCLSKQGDADEICNERSNISVISSGLCEKITSMTFADEPTSCFMFSRIGLRLLQECNSGTISTLMVQNQCLILSVVDPVKARITLWYEGRSIKQKVQIISAAEGNHLSDEVSCEESMMSLCRGAIDRFFAPAILHLETTREVECETVVVRRQCSYSLEPQVALNEPCELNGILWNGLQPPKQFSQIYNEENEESARKCLNAGTLECLTAISEISRQLHGDAIPEEDEIVVDPNRAETDYLISLPDHETTSSPPVQCTISSEFQQATCDHESDAENRNLSMLRSPGSVTTEANELSFTERDTKIEDSDDPNVSVTTEANKLSLKASDSKIENSNDANGAVTTEANELSLKESDTKIEDSDDANVLGRTQFEEHRQSRSYFFAKLPEDLKKKGVLQNMNPLEDSEGSSVETSGDEIPCVGESSHVETHDHGNGEKESVVRGIERADGWKKSNEENCTDICEYTKVVDEKETPGVLQTRREKETRTVSMTTNCAKSVNDATLPEATEENQKDIIETVLVNILPKTTVANDILKEATGVSQNECETGFFNDIQMHHEKVNDLEISQRGTAHGKDVDARNTEIGPVDSNGTKESVIPEKEVIFQSKSSKYLHAPTKKTPSPHFKEGNDVLTDGLCDQDVTNFHGSKTGSGSLIESDIGELPVKRAESDLQSHSKNSPSFEVRVLNCERSKNADTYSTKRENEQLQSLSTRREVHDKDGMETSSRSPFLGGDVVADGDTTNALPPTTENRSKGYTGLVGIGLKGGQVIKRDKSVDDVKRISELDLNRNLGLIPFENGDVVDGPIRASKDNSYMFPGFGGARPKQVLPRSIETTGTSTRFMDPIQTEESEKKPLGLDPVFLARHSVTNSSLSPSSHFLNYNGAAWEDPLQDTCDVHYVLAKSCNNLHNDSSLMFGEGSLQRSYKSRSSSRRSSENEAFATGSSMQGGVHSGAIDHTTPLKQDESWHFPPLPILSFPQIDFYDDQECSTQQNLTQVHNALFDYPESRSYNDFVSMTNEFNNRNNSYGENPVNPVGDNHVHSVPVSEGQQNSTVDSTASLLVHLQQTMAKTVNLMASTRAAEKHVKPEQQSVGKVGIQEQASRDGENEHTETARDRNSRELAIPPQRNERTVDVNLEREERPAPVQESPRPVCGHYQRRCLVRFPCCERFYPCHRCHNESKACSDDQARAINATHIRCTICYHDQVIDEGSQKCHGCNSKMSDYFCAICKHFTSVDKNPFHCEKCGICRIHSDKSFHCDICNVCLDKRLQGKHKCRPDSGHDECCICLEDAFSGCQILPCSHKVHKDCAIAMIQNGVRTCPICRHPLFQQPGASTQ